VAGARVNDRTATNVAQIVISGTMRRHTPAGVVSMPAFGSTHSDTEIATVSNYVTKARRRCAIPASPTRMWQGYEVRRPDDVMWMPPRGVIFNEFRTRPQRQENDHV
jgi:hypothetical protein